MAEGARGKKLSVGDYPPLKHKLWSEGLPSIRCHIPEHLETSTQGVAGGGTLARDKIERDERQPLPSGTFKNRIGKGDKGKRNESVSTKPDFT